MELKIICEDYERRELTVAAPQIIKAENMKKILEAIFHQTDFKLTLKTTREKKDNYERKKNEGNNIIVFEANTMTYADTIKKLKEGLKDSDTLEHIKGVRKTMSGKVMIEISEQADKDKVINGLKENCNLAKIG